MLHFGTLLPLKLQLLLELLHEPAVAIVEFDFFAKFFVGFRKLLLKDGYFIFLLVHFSAISFQDALNLQTTGPPAAMFIATAFLLQVRDLVVHGFQVVVHI